MAITIIQSARDIIQRIRTDVQRNLDGSNPFLRNGLLSAMTIAFGNRFFDQQRLVAQWKDQFFVNTANLENLRVWGDLRNIQQGVASASSGPIVITGTAGTIIDANSVFTSGQLRFRTRENATIAQQTVRISQLSQISGTATAITDTNHNLATGMTVNINGASDPRYNGEHEIVVTDRDRFTYDVDPATPTSQQGVINVVSISILVNVDCETTGSNTNLSPGNELQIEANQLGVDPTALVAFGGLGGGSNDETEESFRQNVLDAWQNPTALFNETAIRQQAKSIRGVTRVWVERATPNAGQVTIYFTRDNDTNLIPSQSEVDTTKARIVEIAPMTVDIDDIFVLAPTAVPVNFEIEDLFPDSNSMRDAVRSSLQDFFRTGTAVGRDLTVEDYNAAIKNTYDVVSGTRVLSFNVQLPSGDITITDGQIATLGTVDFV